MEIFIAFSYPKKFKIGAWVISRFLKKPYSHVLIYWKTESLNRTLVYQASHGHVHFIEFNNFLRENNLIKVYNLIINREQFINVSQKCVDLASQPYDFKGVIALGLHEFLLNFGIKTRLKDHKGYFCSELLASLLEDVFDKPFLKDNHLIKPSDIELFLQENLKNAKKV